MTARPLRRRVLVAALAGAGLGVARAEEAVSTDDIRIPVGPGDVGGFRAQPARAGPFACVIVAADPAAGRDWTSETCRRFAREGYLAVAPELWGEQAADDEVMARLDAAALWAGQHGGDAGRIGLAGFGGGGRIAWLYAARGTGLRAAVAWGGTVSSAAELKAPLLGLYGKDDPGNPRAALLRAENAAGGRAEIVAYVGAGARFGGPGPGYDAAAAMDGWTRMLAWFKRNGVA